MQLIKFKRVNIYFPISSTNIFFSNRSINLTIISHLFIHILYPRKSEDLIFIDVSSRPEKSVVGICKLMMNIKS